MTNNSSPLLILGFIDRVIQAQQQARGDLWFRGHGSLDWNLLPTVMREDRGNDREHQLLIRFMKDAPVRHKWCPSSQDLPAWIQLAQHYGLPTRLLDWTLSPLTALYFAVCDESLDREAGVVWVLNPYSLNKSQLGRRALAPWESQEVASLVQAAFKQRSKTLVQPQVFAIPCGETDIRMMMQLAMFTIHSEMTPMQKLFNGPPELLVGIPIPPDIKFHMRKGLEWLGVRRASLFPDLQNLAAGLAGANFIPE